MGSHAPSQEPTGFVGGASFPPLLGTSIYMAAQSPFTVLSPYAQSVPPGFPQSGNGLWYTQPGVSWYKDFLPIGNGYLGAMTPGGTTYETTQLNIESLWTGGPFADPTYNGGNKLPTESSTTASDMRTIRQTIFQSPIGEIENIKEISTPAGAYGSYAGAGYLISSLNSTGKVSNYARWLDLDEAITHTIWSQSNVTFIRDSFCSHPSGACVQHLTSNDITLPAITHAFSPLFETGLPTPNITCFDNSTLQVRGLVANPGMLYEFLGRAQAVNPNGAISISCQSAPSAIKGMTNATLTISGASDSWFTWVGATEFDQNAGDQAHGFTFCGPDPHMSLTSLVTSATSPNLTYASIVSAHTNDFKAVMSPFALSLGQSPNFTNSTDQLVAGYKIDVGDPYLEWLLFNYGRYLLASSARGILPANLQGKWAKDARNIWSSDYHSNINIQMNYWIAEMTNMDVTGSLFDYFEKNWAPRGAETAQVLYNISRGWVTHNEMNIFGHTGMKLAGNSAIWADYPESAVWMMDHAWDHFDYTNDVNWWKKHGWPLVKGVASFHLDKLIPDLYFNDSTLVVNPCNSPEQAPITLGCAHSQQLIWQLFNSVEKGYQAAGDTDSAFLEEVIRKRAQMDKGIRIGSWGQLQEWKVEKDKKIDTHRHLSHLTGLYPGYALTSYDPSLQGGLLVNGIHLNYTKDQVLDAAKISLVHRGNGTGPDGDTGWEKAWRAACWAQLGNATEFYHMLSYVIGVNFGPNLFSLFDPSSSDPIFQIDANLGYPAAVLNALLQAPDVPNLSTPLVVTLLPALPSQWSSGSIKGARIRGGISVSFQWSGGIPTDAFFAVDPNAIGRNVRVVYANNIVGEFVTTKGSVQSLSFA